MAHNADPALAEIPAQAESEKPERLSEKVQVSITPSEKYRADVVARLLGMSTSALFRKLTTESSLFRYVVAQSIESNPVLPLGSNAVTDVTDETA